MFDVLTYQKGGSVLRMLEQLPRARACSATASAHYLATHAYANTETADLWDALEAASGRARRAPSWTPGSSRAATRWSPSADGRLARPEPFSYSGAAGRAPSARAGRSRSSPGPLGGRRRWADSRPARPAGRGTIDAPADGDARWSTPAARASTGSPTDPSTWPAWPAGSATSPRSSATTWCPTPGPPSSPATRRLADLLRLARALADSGEGDPSVWSVVIGALGLFDRIVARRRAPGAGRRRPAAARPLRPTWAGTRPERRRADPDPAVGVLLGRSAPSATTPTSRPRPARAVRRRSARDPPPPRHRVGGPGHRGRPRRRADEYEASSPATAPGHPPGGEPLPLRPGRLRRRRPGRPDLRSGHGPRCGPRTPPS